MADQQPVFDVTISGSGSVQQDYWLDLGVVPNGRSLLLGYATYIAEDKNCCFETRCNVARHNEGSALYTTLLDWTSASGGSSVDRDFYQNGNVNTVTPVSTGVEKLWLHVVGHSGTAGAFDYILRYTVQ